MAPNFLQRTRMDSIYNPAGPVYGPTFSNVQPPDLNAGMINFGADTGPHQTFGGYVPNERYFDEFRRAAQGQNYMPGTTTTAPMNVRWGEDTLKPDNIPAKDKANLDYKYADLERKRQASGDTLDLKYGDQAIRQQRADIYDFKSRNPGMKIVSSRGGNYQAIDPITGKATDTGVPTGTLSREEELQMQGDQRMDQINTRGAIQQNLTGQRGQQRLGEIGGQKDVKGMTPDRPMLPTQTRVDQNNRARELSTDQKLGQYIHVDSTGQLSIDTPGRFSGPSPEDYNKIRSYIFGNETFGGQSGGGQIKSITPVKD
jgi:hypothetical protein